MFKSKIIQAVGDIKRFSEIVTAFSIGGFHVLAKKIKVHHCASLRCQVRCYFKKNTCPEEDLPKKLREILTELGPTFVKFGQILSMRPDFIPQEYVEELKKLQDEVPAFSFSEVKKIIQTEFNKPLSKIYKSFEEKPVAAASLSQVHMAYLSNGKKVAVKVQRPNLQHIIEKDLRIILYLASLLEKHVPETRNFRPTAAAKEFANYTLKELDFVTEGKNADRFKYNFRKDKGIKIPLIYWDYTTRRVLTMEFIDGIKMGNLHSMKKKNVDHKILAENCTRACSEPILIHGFFHADPHPGNVWVIKGNKVCYLDFGMVGMVTKEMKKQMLLFFRSLLNKEVDSALRHLLKLTEQLPDANTEQFKSDASEIIYSLYLDSTKKKTLAKTFYQIISSAAQHGIIFPSNMVLLAKALMTGETMCLMTHKDFDLIENSKPTIERIFREEFGPNKVIDAWRDSLPELIEFLERLPSAGLGFLTRLERGELNINLNIKEGGQITLTHNTK